MFKVCFPYTRSHSRIYTNTLYKSMCAPTPTHSPLILFSLALSHTHTHSRTPTRSQSYTTTCQYCGQAFIKPLHTHSPLAIFGRRTMRNDSKMEMCDMFPYKATLNPTSVFSLSVCTRLVVQSSEKKAPAYKKLSGNDSRPPKPGL